MPRIRAQHVSKVFGRRSAEALRKIRQGADADELRRMGVTAAVADVSFEVNEGEIFVVMGLSGSGKSTLIRMLNGLLEPTAGSIEIDGVDITAMGGKELRRLRQEKVSMVFQHFALFPHRTVLENAAYALETRNVPKQERLAKAREFLNHVGLAGWEDRYPDQLSGGMQQRVGIARALSAETDILLMDEAFSALDPMIRREMQDLLLDLQGELGKTIVFITHDLNEAMRLGDRVAMLRHGRVMQIGTAEEILTDPANDYVAQFVADVDRTRVLTARSVMDKPIAVVDANGGPRAAVRVMREQQTSFAFVVTRDRRLAGVVFAEPAAKAVRAGRNTLDGLVEGGTHPVDPDTPVADLFLPCAESPLPVPVTDRNGKLIGVIPRVTLLAALGHMGNTGEMPVVREDTSPPEETTPRGVTADA
ncbi:glycine betaine/L-proline ABC transporter ATP-binding protein [Actinoallomurus liliacearum]|uniref:Glycine betaine/L-proline ABC transporter ATP-binding protein n=1 Tax=Actinoallomurus liliacearum TaxID=1080073 RepID=A0ABP8TX83_9ACTN